MLGLKLFSRSLCLIQAYGPNSISLYLKFVEEITYAPKRVKTNESKILLGDFNIYDLNDASVL